MDAGWRRRALRELGVQPLTLREPGPAPGKPACVVLAPVAARDGAAAQALVEAIAAAAAMLGLPARVHWQAAGAEAGASAQAQVLALGVGRDSGGLPEPAALLADPARKREVWRAVVALAAGSA